MERALHERARAIHRRFDSREPLRADEGRSMNTKMRVGLIGAGGIAQTYVQALTPSATAELVGVADVRPDAACALAERAGCQQFMSYEDMLEQTACEAAIVCTPPVTHPEICCWLLDRGVHVLCEKPLA